MKDSMMDAIIKSESRITFSEFNMMDYKERSRYVKVFNNFQKELEKEMRPKQSF